MFEIIRLLFTWLPTPLDDIVFGAVCILLLLVLVKLVAKVIDMLPFL